MKVFGRTLGLAALTLALQGCLMDQAAREEGAGAGPSQIAGKAGRRGAVVSRRSDESGGAQVDILSAIPPEGTLWERIRDGLQLPDRDRREVAEEVAWFADHQRYMDRVTDRAALYLPMVLDTIEAGNFPTELALLPVLESSYEPLATSPSKAAGLWQFIPETGKRFGLRQTGLYDGRRDPTESTRAALEYLTILRDRYQGDWLLALAAYNWGEGNLDRAIARNRERGKPTDFWSLDLRKETRTYVPRLLALAEVVASPERYGLALKSFEEAPVLAAIQLGSPIDLKLAAQLADVEVEELKRYNPAYQRGTTDGPGTLMLPSDKMEEFSSRLAQLPPEQWVRTRYHEVKRGETLAAVASAYWLSEEQLRQANGLSGKELRPGSTLVIPEGGMIAKAPQSTQVADARTKTGGKKEYLVRPGDTLASIARQQKMGLKELLAMNSLSPKEKLKPGRKIVVAAATPPASPHHAEITLPLRRIGYTVQKGDSLAGIAERFQVSVHDIRRWNDDIEKVKPGQELTLYLARGG